MLVNQLVDFCYGKEAQPDDVGAVARFVRAHVTTRPALQDRPRWPDIDALKTHARHSGPNVTAAQIDAAVTAAAPISTALCEGPALSVSQLKGSASI